LHLDLSKFHFNKKKRKLEFFIDFAETTPANVFSPPPPFTGWHTSPGGTFAQASRELRQIVQSSRHHIPEAVAHTVRHYSLKTYVLVAK
jgi:hypothetical protein